MSNLLVQNIKHTNGTTAMTLDSSGNAKIAGHVAQVIQATFSETSSIGSGSATTLINQTFTPKFSTSSSKLIAFATVTPSFVMMGLASFCWIMTFLPLGLMY